MTLTQIAQVCSIIGVTVAIVKLGMDAKKDTGNYKKLLKVYSTNATKEISELKTAIDNIESRISKIEEKM